MELGNRGVYLRNIHVEDIQELYRFNCKNHFYYHAIFKNGFELDYDERELYVSRTSIDKSGGTVWNYLQHLAAETGLEVEKVGNILKMQYDIVDTHRDNMPLVQYVGDKEPLKSYPMPNYVIYPFGCNASQKQSVERALTHQVSIIQGPPGTGKTQTILNIIANLLLKGKSVLVVSNNNSAVENVAEKLSSDEVGLGFLIAQLGRLENREEFIANQPALPNMTDWSLSKKREITQEINEKLAIVSKGFEKQIALAKRKFELEALKTEFHYEELQSDNDILEKDWLRDPKARQLLTLKCNYEMLLEQGKRPSLFFYLKWVLRLGFSARYLLHNLSPELLERITAAYYHARIKGLKKEIKTCEKFIDSIDLNVQETALRKLSLQILKHEIAVGRKDKQRAIFSVKTIKSKSKLFLKEYPVVLSTTYAAKNCISKNMVFDYVIMDEASQVDIATGALSLSCAVNAVIVGDDKQLPNVIDNKMRMALNAIETAYQVDEKFRSSSHSFLQSCCEVFAEAPQTLLREHYRCHPKIIEFCNREFYDGQLIAMTEDKGEENVIRIIRTVPGQHARGLYNQREIDVICKEVLPKLQNCKSVGIITPYRNQSEEINRQAGTDIASTVHKYQGRECCHIIMSMVNNQVTEFSDDPNLLNVAISRAKDSLTVVATGNELQEDSILAQLIAYANYNNFEVKESKIHSVFDLLYKQYTEERLALYSSVDNDLGELSENIMYHTLEQSITMTSLHHIEILCHYPLSKLVGNFTILSEEEREFAKNPMSHVDFLLYNSVTKQPFAAFEVDGWKFHQSEVQRKRDALKDQILDKIGLRMIRLSTVQAVTPENIALLLPRS